jgi:hypothetical protein
VKEIKVASEPEAVVTFFKMRCICEYMAVMARDGRFPTPADFVARSSKQDFLESIA